MRRTRQLLQDTAGLTLLEVMLAVMLLGATLVPMAGLFTGAMVRAVRSQDITMATNIAQLEVERVKSLGYDAVLKLESPVITRQVLGDSRRDYDVKLEIASVSGVSGLLRTTVQVYVSPLEEHPAPVVTVSTYLHPNGI